MGLDLPTPQEVCQQDHQTGSDLKEKNTGKEKGGEDQGTNGAETPRQKCREAVTAGRSWRTQPRVGCTCGVLSMAQLLMGQK